MALPPREQIRAQASGACEYCHLPDHLTAAVFVIEHAIARQHGGTDDSSNLAYACDRCNLHKGPNIAGLDPADGMLTRLFHPRRDIWDEHFEWSGHILVGRTAIGRTTIRVLDMNGPVPRAVRAALMFEGVFPPIGPPPIDV